MKSGTLIRILHMECTICDKIHEIEERKRITTNIIKGEKISYESNVIQDEAYDTMLHINIFAKMLLIITLLLPEAYV